MRAVYSRLLEKMRLERWRVFDRRYSLGKITKLWLVLRGRFGGLRYGAVFTAIQPRLPP